MSSRSFLDGRVVLHPGDCRDVLRGLADASIDSIVTDPPYALVSIGKRFGKPGAAATKDGDVYSRASAGFMGQQWDTGETAFAAEFWAEALRVLKPGGHLLAFSGTRTYHRMVCAIEDAGFEIRDQLAWVYGSGFPKSHDVSKGIDKAAGAIRPVVATETVRDIRNGHGRGQGDGIHAASRAAPVYMEREITAAATAAAQQWAGWGTALKPAWEPIVLGRKPLPGTVAETVVQHGTGALNIDGCRVGEKGGTRTIVGQQHSRTVNAYGDGLGAQGGFIAEIDAGKWPANILHDGSDHVTTRFPAGESRFFYSAKADADDRIGSKHPTVKPVDLMQWLCRLVTPPGGTVLDPFAGTGTTGEAAFREGFRAVLIEREEAYQADIARRMELALAGPATRKAESAKARGKVTVPIGGLFAEAAE